MAETHKTQAAPAAPVTKDAFLADRMAFWSRVTGFTLKTTVGLAIFCAWLWWCAFAGFGLLHIVTLPIAIIIMVVAL